MKIRNKKSIPQRASLIFLFLFTPFVFAYKPPQKIKPNFELVDSLKQAAAPATPEKTKPADAELLGFTEFDPELRLEFKTNDPKAIDGIIPIQMGGISGCSYSSVTDDLLCVSDTHRHAFFRYKLVPPLEAGGLYTFEPIDVRLAYLDYQNDFEDIAVLKDGSLLVSSEANDYPPGNYQYLSFLWWLRPSLILKAGIQIVPSLVPRFQGMRQTSGARAQYAFESVSVDPTEQFVAYATESNPVGEPAHHSRVVVQGLTNNITPLQYDYTLEDLPDNGITSIIALSDQKFLILERSYDFWRNKVKAFVYLATPDGSAVSESSKYQKLKKELLIDLRSLIQLFPKGVKDIDNFEAMTLGPPTSDGSPTLILATDNNFSQFQRELFLWVKPKKSSNWPPTLVLPP